MTQTASADGLRAFTRSILLTVATSAVVFAPVVAFRRHIELDPAMFVTEWLKIVFSSIILFAAVEIYLHRQREEAAAAFLRRLIEAEVAGPLRSAADLLAQILSYAQQSKPYDVTEACAAMRSFLRRATAALYHAPLIAPGSRDGARSRRIADMLSEYDWPHRLDEIETVTEFGPADLYDLADFEKKLRTLSSEVESLNLRGVRHS